jgi:hypothetical protein
VTSSESVFEVPALGAGERYAQVVWRKDRALLEDPTRRRYGETARGEQAQEEAGRMWWPIARWRFFHPAVQGRMREYVTF